MTFYALEADTESALDAQGMTPDQIEALMALPKIKIFTSAFKAGEMTVDGVTRKTLHCTASSTIEDLHGDTMTLECVQDMARQARQKGLTIYLNHKYSVPEDVFGRVFQANTVNSTEKDENGQDIWDLHLDIALASTRERVQETYDLVKTDKINLGVSIGAFIEEYAFKSEEEGFWGGLIINKVNLVETSIVGIPANQRSWVQNSVIAIGKQLGFAEKQIRRVLDGKEDIPAMKTATAAAPAPEPEDEAAPEETNAPAEEPEQVQAEAAPVEETTAEQTTETADETPDGETSPAAAEALAEAAPEVALSLEAGSTPAVEMVLAALETAAETLKSVRAEKASLEAQVLQLTGERDQAIKDRDDAAEIIALVARSPLGRKTQFVQPVQSFRARFAGIYDDAFLKLIDETE